jgi:hypothetical protein
VKHYFVILIGITIISCTDNTSKNNPVQIDSREVLYKTETSIDGIWGLTNYFDTIIAHRELARYRMQRPTWFGILLDIRDYKIFSYGSIYHDSDFYQLNNDTITTFETFDGDWWLIKKSSELILKQMPEARIPDSTIYIYRKRKDLFFMTQNFNPIYKSEKIEPHVQSYFEKELFVGTYRIKGTDQIVSFESNNSIVGLQNYTTFKLDDYFGTSHPFNNEDVLFLTIESSREQDFWNWKFIGNELILTKLDDDPKNGDGFVLTKEIIRLIKD